MKNLTNATRVYIGQDRACRCGCQGKYWEPGTRGFKQAITKAQKLEADDVDETYINFPYGNNRAITVYFD